MFEIPQQAAEMAARARGEVEANWDMAAITARLVEEYRATGAGKARNRRRRMRWPAALSLLRVQIFLEAAYNVGGGAVHLVAHGSLGGIEGRPDHLARFGVHQEDGAFAAAESGVAPDCPAG